MDHKHCRLAIVSSNRFETELLSEALRSGGFASARRFADSALAFETLQLESVDIVLLAIGAGPMSATEWLRRLRRATGSPTQKATVLVVADALTLSLAQEFRDAGANAIIGKPLSAGVILSTIKKVLAKPRAFIECESYAGPCRRPGIVTAGAMSKRRRSDAVGAGPTVQ